MPYTGQANPSFSGYHDWKPNQIITEEHLDNLQNQVKQIVDNVPNIISVGNQAPNNSYNQIWIKTTTEEGGLQIPIMEDFRSFLGSVAQTYEANKSYTVDQYVVKDNILYKCIKEVSNSSAELSAQNWRRVCLTDEFRDMIIVDNTQPESILNKLWLRKTEIPGTEVPTYDEFKQLKNMIAKEYDSNTTYSIGDYCFHEDKFYRCIMNINNSSSWNSISSRWIETTIGDELKNKIS